jgi:hypothetical protein
MKAEPLDLTQDNRIRHLLEKREKQLAIIRQADRLKREAEAEIREKLGDAVEAFTNDWTVEIKTVRRREYTAQVLRARRLEPPGKAVEGLAGEKTAQPPARKARGRPRQPAQESNT